MLWIICCDRLQFILPCGNHERSFRPPNIPDLRHRLRPTSFPVGMSAENLCNKFHSLGISSAHHPAAKRRTVSAATSHISDSEDEDAWDAQVESILMGKFTQQQQVEAPSLSAPNQRDPDQGVARHDSEQHLEFQPTSFEDASSARRSSSENQKRHLTVHTLTESVSSSERDANVHPSCGQHDSDSSIEIITPYKSRMADSIPSRTSRAAPVLKGTRSDSTRLPGSLSAKSTAKGSTVVVPKPSLSIQSDDHLDSHEEEPYVEPPPELFDDDAYLIYEPSKSKTPRGRRKVPATPKVSTAEATDHSLTPRSDSIPQPVTPCGQKYQIKTPAKISRKSLAKDFVQNRDELCLQLVQQLDQEVFEGRLPHGLTILWSKRSACIRAPDICAQRLMGAGIK